MRIPRLRLTVGRMMIAVALISMLLGGYVYWRKSAYCRLTVVNRSGQAIPRLSILVGGERREIEDLADGSSVSVPYWGGRGARFSVAGFLADRTRVGYTFGISGDPRGFEGLVGTVDRRGQFKLSLDRKH